MIVVIQVIGKIDSWLGLRREILFAKTTSM